MMSEDFDFSLDDLVVEDQEVPSPIVLTVSVVVSETEYPEQAEDVRKLRKDVETQFTKDYDLKNLREEDTKKDFSLSRARVLMK